MNLNKVKNIGDLNGPIVVFGGIYSNLEALVSLKVEAEKCNIPPTNIICTGDIIAYCANPLECVRLVRDWGIHCIAGNVELSLVSGDDDCGCNFNEGSRCDILSRQWYPFAQSKLGKDEIGVMDSLPHFLEFSYHNKKCFVLHGSIFNTSEFIFSSSAWETKSLNFEEVEADLIIAGHCGLPFYTKKDSKYWLNPGVIGMPANNGKQEVWYGILNHENQKNNFQLKELSYNYNLAQNKMRINKLPEAYAKTLSSGIWDNCEILPDLETQMQGKDLEFESISID